MIKEAIEKRASYFKANSQTITSLGARRLLEEDLKLDKNSLDEYKSFINKKLEEVLLSPEVVEPRKVVKERPSKKSSLKKASVKDNSDDENEDSSQSESTSENEEDDEERIKLKKKPSQQRKTKDNVGLKKRKRSAESKVLSPARKKSAKPEIQNGTDAEDDNSSEDGSQSSAEATVKKKREMPTQVYGKHVEHLKSIIKSCGMSVAPTVYKRAKQVPESKRETFLLKELEEILRKEGLSSNPSEKEIKAVKRKKEKAKELEGIDTSNIITSSRRRTVEEVFIMEHAVSLQTRDETSFKALFIKD
ncbi:hypothetical protein QJS10_CPA06g02410 [Acorus calamus]|uniref:Histone chaperone domain-containing protein n=1 Tax=Acorus calamus TaxID=4465 RepID=A0AAV9EIZ2_ACOCL|nr:hypothetical protein QJS10_CPA06g02410 [Acorus calamus]